MLKFISEQTVARGLEFQLGLWMHGYEWINSPKPNYTIEGLTRETHGPYCRDAVRTLLKALPGGERGHLPRPRRERRRGRQLRFLEGGLRGRGHLRPEGRDRHARQGHGPDHARSRAWQPGLPVKVSPKYWAEHMGMPYHQADIRELERPQPRPAGERADEIQLRVPQFPPLRLRRPAAGRPQVGRAAPHLAGHPASAALGRSADRRGALAGLQFLRQRRRRDHGAALLQGPPRFRDRAATARLRRRLAAAALGLGEIRLQPQGLGTAAIQPRCGPGLLAALSAASSSARARRQPRRPWPMPAAFCPSSPPPTEPRPATTRTGRKCT